MHATTNMASHQWDLWTGKRSSAQPPAITPKSAAKYSTLSSTALSGIPSDCGRRVWPINKHVNGFKAEEWSNFLMRDSVLTLPDVIPDDPLLAAWRGAAEALWVSQRKQGFSASDLPKIARLMAEYVETVQSYAPQVLT